MNNIEQQNFLDDVYYSIENNISKIFFLAGSAGTGKSTLMKKIIHKTYLTSKNVFVIVSYLFFFPTSPRRLSPWSLEYPTSSA